jgi:peptidyl-prolyl cis-trans isomerase C
MSPRSWFERSLVTLLVLGCALALAAGDPAAAQKSSGKSAKKSSRSAKAPAIDDSNRVLVKVGKDPITRGDVQRRIDQLPDQYRANYSTPDGRKQILDRMIEERVWMQMATKAGVAARPAIQQQLDQQRRDLIIRTHLNEIMATSPAASDSEAHAYYDAHLEEYRVPATVSMRHILTKKEKDAQSALKAVKAKGADWDKLVTKWSVDTLTRANGGNLGTVTLEGQFAGMGAQPALAESAFKIAAGGVGGPYQTDKGWHVIKVDAVKEESVRPFEQVRAVITRQLNSTRQQGYYQQVLQDSKDAVKVTPDSAAVQNFLSQRKTPREEFNEAQTLPSPQARLDAYRKLLQEHPDADVAPQAQFMIGFIYSEELKDHDAAEQAFRELLKRWPQAELANSAQWMIDHMRSEEPPAFIPLEGDADTTNGSPRTSGQTPAATGKP